MGETIDFMGMSDLAKWIEENKDGMTGIVVLGITKENQPLIRTSRIDMVDNSFMCQFYSAWIGRWFFREEGQ